MSGIQNCYYFCHNLKKNTTAGSCDDCCLVSVLSYCFPPFGTNSRNVTMTFKDFQSEQRKRSYLEHFAQSIPHHHIERLLLVALGLHHAEFEPYTL